MSCVPVILKAASMQLELFRVYTGGAKLITASEKIALECNATHAIAAKVASMVVIGHGLVMVIVEQRYSLICATSHCWNCCMAGDKGLDFSHVSQ